MTNLDSIFKSRDITLPTKICLVKGMVFPVVMCGCESWPTPVLLPGKSHGRQSQVGCSPWGNKESVLPIRWPKYWRFSFSISPSNEYSGLISFRMNWFDFLAVQGILKSLLQHHSSKASAIWCSAFFMIQISHPNMTTEKTVALTRQIFVGKVMFLLFNMMSRYVITFLPRSKRLLISWLQSQSSVILEPKKVNLSLFPLFPHLFAMK